MRLWGQEKEGYDLEVMCLSVRLTKSGVCSFPILYNPASPGKVISMRDCIQLVFLWTFLWDFVFFSLFGKTCHTVDCTIP